MDQGKEFEATVKVLDKEKTFASPKAARQGIETMLSAAIEGACRQYGLTIVTSEVRVFNHGSYWQTTPAKKDDVLVFAFDFMRFLSGYSVNAIRRTGLRQVVLCQDTVRDGKQYPWGSASQDTVLWPLKYMGEDSTDGLEHELYHVFDTTMLSSWGIDTDREWVSLNPVGFSYKGYERFLAGSEAEQAKAQDQAAPEGFVSAYAAASEWEDKAETYYAMIRRSKWLQQTMEKDKHVRAKVELVERRMRLLGPEYVPGFWKKK